MLIYYSTLGKKYSRSSWNENLLTLLYSMWTEQNQRIEYNRANNGTEWNKQDRMEQNSAEQNRIELKTTLEKSRRNTRK